MREYVSLGGTAHPDEHDTNIASWYLRLRLENEKLTPTEDSKEDHIGPLDHHVTKQGSSLSKCE